MMSFKRLKFIVILVGPVHGSCYSTIKFGCFFSRMLMPIQIYLMGRLYLW